MDKEFTDMYLIAALLAYGFQYSKVDRTNRNRQKFCYSTAEEFPVRLLDNGTAIEKILGIEEIERQYTLRNLLYPPNYPDTLRSIKFAILSNK